MTLQTRLRQSEPVPARRETILRLAPGVRYILVRGHALPLAAIQHTPRQAGTPGGDTYGRSQDSILWGSDLYDVFTRGVDDWRACPGMDEGRSS